MSNGGPGAGAGDSSSTGLGGYGSSFAGDTSANDPTGMTGGGASTSGNASPAGDPSDPGNLGGMGTPSGMSAALGDGISDADAQAAVNAAMEGQSDTVGNKGGGWWGGLTDTQQSLAETVAFSVATANLPTAIAALAALALSGAGTGDMGTIGEGIGADNVDSRRQGYVAPQQAQAAAPKPAPSVLPTDAEAAKTTEREKAKERKGRASTLLTGPEGLLEQAPVQRKSLLGF